MSTADERAQQARRRLVDRVSALEEKVSNILREIKSE